MPRPRRWLALITIAGLLAACSAGPAASGGGQAGGVTLSMEGPGEPQSDNFNPFLPTSSLASYGISTFIYEPLLQFNPLKPNAIYPWLATGYRWSDGNRTLTFTLRKGVTWSDGKPFSSADVLWTFEALKRFPAINLYGVTFSSVRAQGPETVVMTFAKPSYAEFYNLAGETLVVPAHVWAHIANPSKALNTNPVGTGPMLLRSFSSQNLTLVKNPHYWQAAKVKVAEMQFPTESVNTDVTLLGEGQMDWASGAFPHLQQTFVAKSKDNHYWFPADGVVSLVPNLTVWPLGITAVRKAISLALDRQTISAEGEYGYEAPATSPTGLILPNDQQYLAPQYRSLRLTRSDAQATALLKSAGFSPNAKGLMAKGGKTISLTITDPTDFPDYMTDDQIIADALKQVGISVQVSGVSVPSWTSDLNSGPFQLTVDYSNAGPGPYVVYDGWLDDTLSAPVGKNATGDVERWQSPATQALLGRYQDATTDAARASAIQGLEGVMVGDMPVIPLVYSAVWGEYRTAKVTGWPSASDAYDPASSYPPTNEVVLTHLRPTG